MFAPIAVRQEPTEHTKRKREDEKSGKKSKKARKSEIPDQHSETTEPKVHDRHSNKDKSGSKKKKAKKEKSHQKNDKSNDHAPAGVQGTSEVLQTSDLGNSTPVGADPPTCTTTPVIPPPVLETVPPLPTTTAVAPVLDTVLPPVLGFVDDPDVPNEPTSTVNPANLQNQDPGRLRITDGENENENKLAAENVDEESGGIGNRTHKIALMV